jgi:hypothetical protein
MLNELNVHDFFPAGLFRLEPTEPNRISKTSGKVIPPAGSSPLLLHKDTRLWQEFVRKDVLGRKLIFPHGL